MRTNGRNLRKIPRGGFFDSAQPAWSPDGRRIAFAHSTPNTSTDDAGYDIWVMNANGTAHERLTTNQVYDGSPSWSPDGRRFAFVRGNPYGGKISVMNANGTGVTRLLSIGANPAWQPHPAP